MIKLYCDGCDQEFRENEATKDVFVPITTVVIHRRPIPGTPQGIESQIHLHFCDFECMRDWAEKKSDTSGLGQLGQ